MKALVISLLITLPVILGGTALGLWYRNRRRHWEPGSGAKAGTSTKRLLLGMAGILGIIATAGLGFISVFALLFGDTRRGALLFLTVGGFVGSAFLLAKSARGKPPPSHAGAPGESACSARRRPHRVLTMVGLAGMICSAGLGWHGAYHLRGSSGLPLLGIAVLLLAVSTLNTVIALADPPLRNGSAIATVAAIPLFAGSLILISMLHHPDLQIAAVLFSIPTWIGSVFSTKAR